MLGCGISPTEPAACESYRVRTSAVRCERL